jgi:hypothetical protein
MSVNGFKEEELVCRRVKVGNEWQSRTFPVVGGRLRILHENNDDLSIQTEIIRLEDNFAVVKAAVESQKGKFNGTGTASIQRDAKLADSLVELAETRAIARALRFGGIGVEYTSAEEISHVPSAEPEKEQTCGKLLSDVLPGGKRNDKPETKPAVNGNGRATQAQCRALYALTRRANYSEEDFGSMLRPLNVSTFQDLSREDASSLITSLQTEVAA